MQLLLLPFFTLSAHLLTFLPGVHTDAHNLNFYNNCPYPVWVGSVPNAGIRSMTNGGFKMEASSSNNTHGVGHGWSGRVWARTGCDPSTMQCQTGDCGGKLECTTGPTGPTTVVQFAFNSLYGRDQYEVSLIDGFNVPIQVASNYYSPSGDYYHCGRAGCKSDLNVHCPADLSVHGTAHDVIGCRSPCQAFDTDQYCCRGEYNQADRCRSADWPVSHWSMFKNACPDARNYRYDATVSPFFCGGAVDGQSNAADYNIYFCPK